MSQHYNQSYSANDIADVLQIIKNCLRQDNYIISKNNSRKENIDFINEYNLTSKKQKDIILALDVSDFCHSLQNTNQGFEHEVLYVFCPQKSLFNFDNIEEVVDIYIKFNILDLDQSKKVIVISFHKRNKPIDYSFR